MLSRLITIFFPGVAGVTVVVGEAKVEGVAGDEEVTGVAGVAEVEGVENVEEVAGVLGEASTDISTFFSIGRESSNFITFFPAIVVDFEELITIFVSTGADTGTGVSISSSSKLMIFFPEAIVTVDSKGFSPGFFIEGTVFVTVSSSSFLSLLLLLLVLTSLLVLILIVLIILLLPMKSLIISNSSSESITGGARVGAGGVRGVTSSKFITLVVSISSSSESTSLLSTVSLL